MLSQRPQDTRSERVARQIRGYWGVENKVHWRRDVPSGEDHCRLRDSHAACVLAWLRTALLALARHSSYANLKVAQEEYAHRPQRALRLLCFQRLTQRE